MMSHWPLSFWVKLHHFTSWIDSVVCFVMYNFVLWMSILIYVFVWVFVMYIFVRMTIHIAMGFHHVHLCTNDYPYYYGFSSCDPLYEWLSISLGFRHVHFCTNDYHFFLNGFSSCTFLYEWLPFLFEWIFAIHISIRMTTISLYMGFRHAHYVQMTFHILCIWISSCTFLCEWLPIFFWFSMCAMLFSAWKHGAVTNYKRYMNVYRFWPCA